MKTVSMTRREATLFYEHCTRCGRPPRGPGEDRDEVQKFKYAVGRNYQIAGRIHDQTERRKIEVMTDPPEMPEAIKAYERERHDILMKHAKRNKAGQAILRRDEQTGETNPVISPDDHTAVMAAIDELQKRYAPEIAAWNSILAEYDRIIHKAQNAVDDEIVTFDIYIFPFDRVPESISGTHLADLSIMLTGVPELEESDNTPLDQASGNGLQKTPEDESQ